MDIAVVLTLGVVGCAGALGVREVLQARVARRFLSAVRRDEVVDGAVLEPLRAGRQKETLREAIRILHLDDRYADAMPASLEPVDSHTEAVEVLRATGELDPRAWQYPMRMGMAQRLDATSDAGEPVPLGPVHAEYATWLERAERDPDDPRATCHVGHPRGHRRAAPRRPQCRSGPARAVLRGAVPRLAAGPVVRRRHRRRRRGRGALRAPGGGLGPPCLMRLHPGCARGD